LDYTRHIPSPIMHRVVSHGETLYFGGMVAEDRSQSMAGQTEQILKRMEAMLLECGSARTKVLAATIFVTDLAQKKEMDEVWVGFFGKENLPARATVGVANLGSPETRIEVVVTASK
jgi:2-iminobutanoate/2-iminopropanoate deaminase